MNPAQYSTEDCINFVIATPCVVTATEAGRVQPESEKLDNHRAVSAYPVNPLYQIISTA